MKAFHGDIEIKEKYMSRVRAHAEADEIIKGHYWEDGKGCAVGCTIHSGKHNCFETELGIPEWLARLEDTIFEGLPNGEAKAFPLQFLSAIKVGADMTPVKWKFCAFLMRKNIERVLALTMDEKLKEQVVSAVRGVLALHETAIKTGKGDESAARSAAESARSAARSARSAARSAAWSAESAAWSAESAASAAAWSAAWSAESAAWSAAWSARSAESFVRLKDELLRLLSEAQP